MICKYILSSIVIYFNSNGEALWKIFIPDNGKVACVASCTCASDSLTGGNNGEANGAVDVSCECCVDVNVEKVFLLLDIVEAT